MTGAVGRRCRAVRRRCPDGTDESGVVLVFVLIMVAVLLGMLALVVDIGNARQQRRQAQVAADAAALSAAEVIEAYGPGFEGSPGQWTSVLQQVKGYAQQNFGVAASAWTGCDDASALAYTPDTGNSNSCISADFSAWPVPLPGDPIHTVNRVRVRIPQRTIETFFGQVLGADTLTTGAASTAAITRTSNTITNTVETVTPGGPCALCILQDTGKTLDGQNGDVTITGGGVVANSTGTSSACSGPNSGCASYLNPNGNVKISTPGNTIGGPGAPSKWGGSGTYNPAPTYKDPISDPLAAVPQCGDGGLGDGTTTTVPSECNPGISRTDNTTVLQPGVYTRIRDSHTLSPGVYVLKGDITLNGNDLLQGDGVMLYMACSQYPLPCNPGQVGAGIKTTGNGAMRLTGPTSGTFKGLVIFADRNNAATQTFRGNGTNESGPQSGSSGTIYMKTGTLDLRGNGYTLASMIVTGLFSMNGNPSAVTIAYDLDKNVYVETHHTATSTTTAYSYDANGLID